MSTEILKNLEKNHDNKAKKNWDGGRKGGRM